MVWLIFSLGISQLMDIMRKCEAHEMQRQDDGSVKFGSGTKELKGRDDGLTRTEEEVWLVLNKYRR